MIPILNTIYTLDIEVKPIDIFDDTKITIEDEEFLEENANFLPWCSEIYGMSVAWGREYTDSAYFTGNDIYEVIKILSDNKISLGAHNVFYDWSNLAYKYQLPLKFVTDSGVVSQCINNSSFIKSFGLKQTVGRLYNIETQEVELKSYLKLNHKIAESKYGRYIHLCPAEMIEKYCRLDSVYCWRIIHDAPKWLKSDISQYMKIYINEVEMTILQFFEGILVDKEGFQKSRAVLQSEIDEIENNFLTNEELIPHIHQVQLRRLAKDQSKLKKKLIDFDEWNLKNKFNINSSAQLKMMFDSQKLHWNEEKQRFDYPYVNENAQTGIKNPDSPKLGTKFLYAYGTGGQILADRGEKVTLTQHIDRALEESSLTGKIHPFINLLGTRTGRISSSGVNILAVPFSEPLYAEFLIVEEGWELFSIDVKALEPTLLACLSGDNLLRYITCEGEGKKPFVRDGILYVDDMYISAGYSASFSHDEIVSKFDADTWLENPKLIKSNLKNLRDLIKNIVLTTNYGGGPQKVQDKIREDMKVIVPLKTIDEFQRVYWQTFIDAALYKKSIENEAKRKGYLINIGGYPLTFYDRPGGIIRDTHKALNEMLQSSAAVVMKSLLYFFYPKVKYNPNIKPQVCNHHDALFGKCKIEYMDKLLIIIKETLEELNNALGLPLKIRVDFNHGKTFYQAKGS